MFLVITYYSALALFPFSGRSETRKMVFVSNLLPRTSNRDLNPDNRCLLSPWKGNTILTKTRHDFYKLVPESYLRRYPFKITGIDLEDLYNVFFNNRGVLLIRNPWDALVENRVITRNIQRNCHGQCGSRVRALSKSLDFEGEGKGTFTVLLVK